MFQVVSLYRLSEFRHPDRDPVNSATHRRLESETVLPDGEKEENSIVFDGENGTMKVSGGPRSVFAGEIRGLIEFWVEGRKEIPCFLAACTLEFYERSTRAAKA